MLIDKHTKFGCKRFDGSEVIYYDQKCDRQKDKVIPVYLLSNFVTGGIQIRTLARHTQKNIIACIEDFEKNTAFICT